MPRVTQKQYLARRHQLADIWQYTRHDYAHLTSSEQRAIHDYYRPAENLIDPQALALREGTGVIRPSLPQVAGRAYAKLIGIREGTVPLLKPKTVYVSAPQGRSKQRTVSVRAVLRPQPDARRLVKALLSINPEELKAMVERMKKDSLRS